MTAITGLSPLPSADASSAEDVFGKEAASGGEDEGVIAEGVDGLRIGGSSAATPSPKPIIPKGGGGQDTEAEAMVRTSSSSSSDIIIICFLSLSWHMQWLTLLLLLLSFSPNLYC